MSWRVTLASLLLALLLCAGCGSSNNSNNVPQTQNPANNPIHPLPTTVPNPYSGPDLSAAVPFQLPHNQDYSGLQAVFQAIYPPLVGDPLVKMILKDSDPRSTSAVSGLIRLAVEDKAGLTARDFNSFPGTSYRDATTFDMIFADNQMVVRTMGSFTGDTLSANIYYRVRQSTDPSPFPQYQPSPKACEYFTLVCKDQNGQQVDPKYCGFTQPDEATPCRSYMNTTDASVVLLGTFQASYSSWKGN